MITVGNEVDLFWKRKLTMASILFALNRYVPFIVTMMGVPYPVSDAEYEVSNPFADQNSRLTRHLCSRGRCIY